MLKHVLDSNLKEYIHKAVGVCGVSAGGFGGTRVIEAFLPVLRELGLVTIFWDGNFSGAQKLFDDDGKILDEATHVKRIDKFLGELIWMSKVLRYGRENVSDLRRSETHFSQCWSAASRSCAIGEPVSTGIFKEPITGRVMLRTLNLDGDRQADLSVHGGPSKAVYGYPSEHYEFWKKRISRDGTAVGHVR